MGSTASLAASGATASRTVPTAAMRRTAVSGSLLASEGTAAYFNSLMLLRKETFGSLPFLSQIFSLSFTTQMILGFSLHENESAVFFKVHLSLALYIMPV